MLVVDDEPRIGKLIGIRLRLEGWEVIATTSGAEGVELARTRKPDIILLDILMPGMDGFEVLQKIRAFSAVPVAVFSANPTVTTRARSMGANDSIAKPFDPDALVEKIRQVLAGGKGTATEI